MASFHIYPDKGNNYSKGSQGISLEKKSDNEPNQVRTVLLEKVQSTGKVLQQCGYLSPHKGSL